MKEICIIPTINTHDEWQKSLCAFATKSSLYTLGAPSGFMVSVACCGSQKDVL